MPARADNLAGGEIHRHAGVGLRVGNRVLAPAAMQAVRAAAAVQQIVSVPSVEPVRAALPGQIIVVARAGQMLDSGQRVALRMPARADNLAGGEIHRHAGIGLRVGRGVAARSVGASVQAVRSAPAFQHIVPAGAGQRIAVVRPDQILDSGQRVALRMPARADSFPGGEIHRHAGIGLRIGHGVVALAAKQAVRSAAPVEDVRAAAAPQQVRVAVAGQRIAVIRAYKVLYSRQRVPLGPAAGAARRRG